MKHGKNYKASAELVDRAKLYDPSEALELCCKTAKAKTAAECQGSCQ